MKIVVDSNRVIAALIKNSTTREILFDEGIEFVAPDFVKTEIQKYRDDIIKKAHLTLKEFDILLSMIFEYIEIIPKSDYEKQIHSFKGEITDQKDIPYLVASLATNADGVWSHDPHFLKQKKVKIFTNIDMLNMNRN